MRAGPAELLAEVQALYARTFLPIRTRDRHGACPSALHVHRVFDTLGPADLAQVVRPLPPVRAGPAELLAEIDRVWDRCGRCGPNGTARRLATLMHAVQSSSPEAARAIGKPSSKWFKQRPSRFVLKAVKGGQQLVTRAAEVVERQQQQEGLDARRKHCGKAPGFR